MISMRRIYRLTALHRMAMKTYYTHKYRIKSIHTSRSAIGNDANGKERIRSALYNYIAYN